MRKRHKSIHEKHNGINERMNDSMLGLRRIIPIFQTWKKDCQGFSHNTTNGDPNSLTQIQVRSRKPHYKSFHNFSTRLIKNHFSKWKIRKLFKQCPIVLSSQLSNLLQCIPILYWKRRDFTITENNSHRGVKVSPTTKTKWPSLSSGLQGGEPFGGTPL